MTKGLKFSAKEKMQEDEAISIENQVREQAIAMMSAYIGETQGRP